MLSRSSASGKLLGSSNADSAFDAEWNEKVAGTSSFFSPPLPPPAAEGWSAKAAPRESQTFKRMASWVVISGK
eukprot:CAMPEP_0177242080 /NCGR_PEP_ID=MMETSP0367-20130122/48619_1 /TAXON_ID=447022 ORGANISM="Scrippsiella hangoei-like, Strain SHHI-4" /NCGR_SAMPLE_ID=MMETSP0367 /ASSEMBLY_ACC=CAM_ASM_000362 /LENGTH=72 /DNA_ID=CAMNT_0018693677 /DNA_START=479 /DNA_END=697 /DNA_ORIENTATION=+